jgi:hypothetical protein
MAGPDPIGDLVRSLLVTYADVTPAGLVLGKGTTPRPEVQALFVRTGPARTLYEDRRPACRSIDGLRGFGGKECVSCADRTGCTPQVLLDVEIDRRVHRLLLAFTSARNFLLFADRFTRDGRRLDRAVLTLRVLDRGRWGELRFDAAT